MAITPPAGLLAQGFLAPQPHLCKCFKVSLPLTPTCASTPRFPRFLPPPHPHLCKCLKVSSPHCLRDLVVRLQRLRQTRHSKLCALRHLAQQQANLRAEAGPMTCDEQGRLQYWVMVAFHLFNHVVNRQTLRIRRLNSRYYNITSCTSTAG